MKYYENENYPEQPSNEALQEEVAKQFAKWDAKWLNHIVAKIMVVQSN